MGYETLEKDSLITLKMALELYKFTRSNLGQSRMQNVKDVSYELDRINSELNIRF